MSTVFATTNKELLIFTLPTDSLSPDSTFDISRFSKAFSLSTLVDNRFIFFIGHSNDHGTDYRNRSVFCINHPRHEIVDAPSLLSSKFRPTLIVCESKLFAFAHDTRLQHIDCPQSSDIFGEVLDTAYCPWNWQALPPLPTFPHPQYSFAFFILAFAVLAPSTIFLSFGSLNDVYVEGEFSITYNISSGTWGDISKALPFYGEAKFSECAGIFYALPCGMTCQNDYFLGSYRLNNDDFSWVQLCRFPISSASPYKLRPRVESFAVSSRNTIFSIRVKTFKPTHSSPTRHFIEFDEIKLNFNSVKQEDGCLIGKSYVNYHFSYTSMDAINNAICQ